MTKNKTQTTKYGIQCSVQEKAIVEIMADVLKNTLAKDMPNAEAYIKVGIIEKMLRGLIAVNEE